jgi:sec-independent protein translocase protein TatA
VFDISPIQIMIVLAIALLIFGPKRLPGMGRDLGRGIRDFKAGISGEADPRPAAANDAATAQPTADRPVVDATAPDGAQQTDAAAAAAGPEGAPRT